MTRDAFIVVDVQNDFCEGGSLAVPGGNQVAEEIAKFLPTLPSDAVVVFTKDWHMKNDPNGGHIALPPAEPDFVDSWPVHCIAGSKGAKFHPALKAYGSPDAVFPVFKKGHGCPSYSGFDVSVKKFRDDTLAEFLNAQGVTHVNVMGLASDYCVRATALDAVDYGFTNVRILADLTRGIATPIEDTIAELDLALATTDPSLV